MVKTKKKSLSEAVEQKHNEQKKKRLNPFELHINRDKQNVLGRKSKADKGLPGVSRAKAIKKRKVTLLHEYILKDKDNLFLDKRIGEQNNGMTQEEKALARFTAERIKHYKKKDIYNLNDEEVLTHKGQTLEEIEKFDDPKSDDEYSDGENRTGKLEGKFVGEAHFGGGLLSKSDQGKSRKDLINELIAESKKRKAEKQKIREQTIDLTEKLDSEWKDLLPIVSAANKSLAETNEQKKADDYDIAVRELRFEAKGMPTDKLKSEEEIVKEEKEKLEALEADRLARMKGLIHSSHSEIKHKSADDLDDGFVVEDINDEDAFDESSSVKDVQRDAIDENNSDASDDDDDQEDNNKHEDNEQTSDDSEVENMEDQKDEEPNTSQINGTVNDAEKQKSQLDREFNSEEYESDDSENDNLSDLKASESSSEDENTTDQKHSKLTLKEKSNPSGDTESYRLMLGNESRQQEIRNDLAKKKEIMENARKELPYTYKVPESYEELQKMFENQNADYQSVIVERIIKCNHWTLNNTNKEKLASLFLFLLQHINDCAMEESDESVVKCFQIFDRLSPFLYDLAHLDAQNAKNTVQAIIKEKHEEFEKNKKRYPDIDTLIFFKLVSLIFPTSDFRHPITTPCLIFLTQILFRCRLKNKLDISKGLFICTLILEYTVLNKRFAPSVINFLRGIIYMCTPKHLVQGIKAIPPFKTTGESSNLLLLEEDQTYLSIKTNGALMKASDLVNVELNDEFRIRALLTSINLLHELKSQLEELDAVYSIFEPILKLLMLNKFDKYPSNVKSHIKQLEKSLMELRNKKLKYMVIEKKKPKPLKMYEPRIVTVYDGKKHKPMSKEKAEREKLLHKYKKGMKGAIREIRKDRAFLAKLQIKQQVKSDEERKRKVKEIFGEAAMQQGELKKLKAKK